MKAVPVTYTPTPLEIVDVDWNGKGVGGTECTKDGEAAVSAALIYWATRTARYGQLSISIIKAWATTNKTFKGNNSPLTASWMLCSMARAAELMKYSPMWREWSSVESVFFEWIDTVLKQPLMEPSFWRWDFRNNWHFSNICARMQLAILREDQKEWKWCVDTYKQVLPAALQCDGNCKGGTSELKRDLTHNQFLLGGLTQAPEMALHQG